MSGHSLQLKENISMFLSLNLNNCFYSFKISFIQILIFNTKFIESSICINVFFLSSKKAVVLLHLFFRPKIFQIFLLFYSGTNLNKNNRYSVKEL